MPSTDPTLNALFGPLSRKYCVWFYWLSVIGMVLLVLMIIGTLVMGLNKGKGASFYYHAIWPAIIYGIFYFQNRLLYTMCTGSI